MEQLFLLPNSSNNKPGPFTILGILSLFHKLIPTIFADPPKLALKLGSYLQQYLGESKLLY